MGKFTFIIENPCKAADENSFGLFVAEAETMSSPEVKALPEYQQEFIKDSFEIAKQAASTEQFNCSYPNVNKIFDPINPEKLEEIINNPEFRKALDEILITPEIQTKLSREMPSPD